MLLLFDTGSPSPTTIVGLLFLIGVSVVAFWKGLLPWLRTQWDAKESALVKSQEELARVVEVHRQELLGEISDARKERDEQRALRGNEMAAFLAELKAQRELHEKGFAEVVRAINRARRRQPKGKPQ